MPPGVDERNRLASHINDFLCEQFSAHADDSGRLGVIGVPGFWEADSGNVKLGKDYDCKRVALVIPYRNSQSQIQACQLRFSGQHGGYHWLSTAEDRLDEEPKGTSSGCPIHWAFVDDKPRSPDELPILVTEGALKAEVFVSLRPPMRVIVTAGVAVGHTEIIEALRGRDALIGFDSDHRKNRQVCRQLGKLIAAREQDAEMAGLKTNTRVVVWDGPKGIDEAAHQNARLRVINIAEWVMTLAGEPLEELENVWCQMHYKIHHG